MSKYLDCAHDPDKRVVAGMRSSGQLHIGHFFGALKNFVELQDQFECFYFVADWHALTSNYEDTSNIAEYVEEMLKDWLACGVDPNKATIYIQSQLPEIAELTLLLSMVTPLGWLERCPTYKEQLQNIVGKDLTNYGFLGYPVLMTADVIATRGRWVPVGQDQVPHLEISREIARRFNNFYGNVFPEPEPRLTPAAKCPGLDGRKMSKSYGNGIFLTERIEDLTTKVRGMLTDKNRLRKDDPGNPDECNLYPYHELLTDEATRREIRAGCASAQMGCVECKQIMIKNLKTFLEPIQARRAVIDAKPGYVREVVRAGRDVAAREIGLTMEVARKAMRVDYLR